MLGHAHSLRQASVKPAFPRGRFDFATLTSMLLDIDKAVSGRSFSQLGTVLRKSSDTPARSSTT